MKMDIIDFGNGKKSREEELKEHYESTAIFERCAICGGEVVYGFITECLKCGDQWGSPDVFIKSNARMREKIEKYIKPRILEQYNEKKCE